MMVGKMKWISYNSNFPLLWHNGKPIGATYCSDPYCDDDTVYIKPIKAYAFIDHVDCGGMWSVEAPRLGEFYTVKEAKDAVEEYFKETGQYLEKTQ